jgi:hypothetical protein
MDTSLAASGTALHPLIRDLLIWLSQEPRSYAETMDGWRSHCPRFTIWEDALADGLVTVEEGSGPSQGGMAVVLTRRGREALAEVQPQAAVHPPA